MSTTPAPGDAATAHVLHPAEDVEARAEWAEVIRAFAILRMQNSRAIGSLGHEHGINATDLRAVGHVAVQGGATPKAVADHLGLTTGAMTTLADRLEAAGLLLRSPNPRDRRSILLHITPKASDVLATANALYEDAFSSVLGPAHSPDWFVDIFLSLADRLAEIADARHSSAGAAAE